MTRRPPQQPSGGDGGGEFARVEALAGLAREVDGLRRGLETLVDIPTRLDDLARTVAQLADAVAATPARPSPTVATSWLAAPADSDALAAMLGELASWLHTVFLRYPDGVAVLPECWLWHPDVVEELLWLMCAWRAAYEGRGASVQLAGDWHDRQRPGVIRRVKAAAGSCSPERHQSRPGWHDQPGGATTVPSLDAADAIARWWAEARDDPAPEPARRPGAGGDWLTSPGLGANGVSGAYGAHR